MAIIDDLKNSDIFGGLEATYLERLSPLCRGSSFRQGAVIFKEGDEAKELYILTDGRIVLEIELRPIPDRPAIPTAIEVITKGEATGWSAVVEPHTYVASARCMTNCTTLAINGEMLRKLMQDDPALGYEVMKRVSKIIARRLVDTRLRLTHGLGLVLLGKQLGMSD